MAWGGKCGDVQWCSLIKRTYTKNKEEQKDNFSDYLSQQMFPYYAPWANIDVWNVRYTNKIIIINWICFSAAFFDVKLLPARTRNQGKSKDKDKDEKGPPGPSAAPAGSGHVAHSTAQPAGGSREKEETAEGSKRSTRLRTKGQPSN